MLQPSKTPSRATEILALARRDRDAAMQEWNALSVEDAGALICEAPLARRAALLDLSHEPAAIIAVLPEAELCFTVKQIGLPDADWVLEHATSEQVNTCVDLDAWRGTVPDRAVLGSWIEALAETSPENFQRAIRTLDAELLVLFLKSRMECAQKPPRDDEDWEPPVGSLTLDGQFYYKPHEQQDELATVTQLLRSLFENDYWTYFRMMQGVTWEPDGENEEWALRWRNARLQDLGFLPWEEAMTIYRYIAPGQRARIDRETRLLSVGEWQLPVWVSGLPEASDGGFSIFRAISQLAADERRSAFFAFVALANKIAVADRFDLADAASTPRAIEKAALYASLGIDYVSRENAAEPIEILRFVSIERLFSVGANLHPEDAKPKAQESPEQS